MHTDRGVTIVEVTRRTGMTRKALRIYEALGLVRPSDRTASGYRLYAESALRRLELVHRAKLLGLQLDEIAEFIAVVEGGGERSPAELVAAVRARLVDTEQQLAELRGLRATLRDTLERLVDRDDAERQPSCDAVLCTCQPGPGALSWDQLGCEA